MEYGTNFQNICTSTLVGNTFKRFQVIRGFYSNFINTDALQPLYWGIMLIFCILKHQTDPALFTERFLAFFSLHENCCINLVEFCEIMIYVSWKINKT